MKKSTRAPARPRSSKKLSPSAGPQVLVIGTGEAFSSDLGNTSYLLFGGGVPNILFDCGYQIPERLWRQELHLELDAICLTHLHADHVFGLIPLLARYWEEKRKHPLTLIGPRGTERFVRKLFDLGYPGMMQRLEFAPHFIELTAGVPLVWNDCIISSARTVHSVLNLSLRVEKKDEPWSLGISGDGQITEATQELFNDVSLLFQEIYSLSPDVPVHADLATFERFVSSSRIKNVRLAHHSRGHLSKLHKRVTQLQKKDSRWGTAHPGQSHELMPKQTRRLRR